MHSKIISRGLRATAFGLGSLLSGLLFINSAYAQTSFPMVTHVTPVAVQRGKTTEVVVEGQQNFYGAYKVLFDAPGLTAEVVPPAKANAPGSPPLVKNVKLKLTVAPDAPLGVREFRVATKLGVSSVGQLLIVDDPVVAENGTNNTPEQANPIKLPCVVHGRIEALEDVDYFKFEAGAGERLTFELFCARLQDKIHDLQKHAKPMLTLYDADGRELAANDCFYFADPMLSYKVGKAGTYYLQVRDSTYDGDARWVYALVATNKPYVSHVFPMAGNPGTVLPVELIGTAKDVLPRATLKVPTELGPQLVRFGTPEGWTNPVTFVVSTLPQFIEQEPNDTPQQANRVTVPCGINGKIGHKRDLDHFVFKAAKGQALRLELKARRFGTLLQSSLHGVLDVMDAKGKILAGNDDTHGKEATLIFTPPADGDFIVRVRDLNSKGGDTAVYYLEVDFAQQDFSLRCDPDKAMIGPGSSTAWYVHVVRANGFAGPVKVDVEGLPSGVTASPLTIPPSMTQGVVVLTAAADAKIDAANVKVVGTATIKTVAGKDESVRRPVTVNQEIYLPGGGRGKFDVSTHAVAVTEPSDILKVDVSTTRLELKPGDEVKIEVTLTRRPDYDKGVSLDILLQHLNTVFANPLPPGVTIVAGKSKTLLGTGNKGHFTLKVAPNAAPIDNVPISVLAHVSINFVVKVSYSSPPIWITIKK
jgi:hypothetical protein